MKKLFVFIVVILGMMSGVVACNALPKSLMIEKLEIVDIVCVDYDNGMYELGIGVKKVQKAGGDGEKPSSEYDIATAKATNLTDALNKIIASRALMPYFGDVDTVVFGNGVMQAGIDKVGDFFIRSDKFDFYSNIYVTIDKAVDLLQELKKDEQIKAISQKAELNTSKDYTTKVNFIDLIAMLQDNSSGVLPLISKKQEASKSTKDDKSQTQNQQQGQEQGQGQEQNQGQGQSQGQGQEQSQEQNQGQETQQSQGQEQKAMDTQYLLQGLCVIKDKKQVGILDNEQSRGYNILKNKIKNGGMGLQLEDCQAGVDNLYIHTKIKTELDNNNLAVNITIKNSASIAHITDNIKDNIEVEKDIEAKLSENTKYAVNQCMAKIKEYQADFVGVLTNYKVRHKKEYEKIKDNDMIFDNLNWSIDCSTNIKRAHLVK